VTDDNPQNWVYAASFAASNGGAYVATHAGRVILLPREGRALVVYDIGTCPFEIVDTGRYAYFLTDRRLYIIVDDNKLAAVLDVLGRVRLVVAQSGFGLLTSRRLQWFTVEGRKVGEFVTRDVIRALWIIAAGVPTTLLTDLKLAPGPDWLARVYFFGADILRVGIVVATELPRDRTTLLAASWRQGHCWHRPSKKWPLFPRTHTARAGRPLGRGCDSDTRARRAWVCNPGPLRR
jgi:hypothetical protein